MGPGGLKMKEGAFPFPFFLEVKAEVVV